MVNFEHIFFQLFILSKFYSSILNLNILKINLSENAIKNH